MLIDKLSRLDRAAIGLALAISAGGSTVKANLPAKAESGSTAVSLAGPRACKDLVFQSGAVVDSLGGGQLPVVTQISASDGTLVQVPSLKTFESVVKNVVATSWSVLALETYLTNEIGRGSRLILPEFIEVQEGEYRSGKPRMVTQLVNEIDHKNSTASARAYLLRSRRAAAEALSNHLARDFMLSEQLFTQAQATRVANHFGLTVQQVTITRRVLQELLIKPQGRDMLISILEASVMTIFEALRERNEYKVASLGGVFDESIYQTERTRTRYFGRITNLGITATIWTGVYGISYVASPELTFLSGFLGAVSNIGYGMVSLFQYDVETSTIRRPHELRALTRDLTTSYVEALKRIGFDPYQADKQGPFLEFEQGRDFVNLPEIPDFKLNRDVERDLIDLTAEIAQANNLAAIRESFQSATYHDLMIGPLPEDRRSRELSRLLTADILDFSETTRRFEELVNYLKTQASDSPQVIASLQQLAGGYTEYLRTLDARLARHEDALHALMGTLDARQGLLLEEWSAFRDSNATSTETVLRQNIFHQRARTRATADALDWQRISDQMAQDFQRRAAPPRDSTQLTGRSKYETDKLVLDTASRSIEEMRTQVNEAIEQAQMLGRTTNLGTAVTQLARVAQTVAQVMSIDITKGTVQTGVNEGVITFQMPQP